MASANLDVALALAAHGVAVFPCQTDKRPRPGVGWRREATTDIARIESWWRRWPDSLPAFEPGRHGLVAIDCDRHGAEDGVAALENLAERAGDDPTEWPTVETPSTGRHVFFRQDGTLTNAKGALPKGIDVRGVGGYVIAEGATLEDGRGYRPVGPGLISALEAGGPPDVPAWLADILKPPSPQPSAPPARATSTTRRVQNVGDRERACFEAGLDAEASAVASAGEGGRNEALNKAAFSIGQMVAAGWGSQSEAETALTDAALACGLRQPEISKTIASGLRAGAKSPRQLVDREGYGDDVPDVEIRLGAPRLAVVDGVTVDPETGEVIAAEADEDPEPADAPPIDDALTRFGGVLGDVVDFIVATSRRPNRRLALAAALPICGTLLGRRMATPTGAALQLYVISTYPTGGGKQHQLDAIDRLLRSVDLQRHAGPSQFMSMSALVKHVAASPLSICAQDEFGAMLKRLSHPRASGHEQGISMVLRGLWGANFATYRTPAYATTASVEIAVPALSLYGVSTSPELYEALRGTDVVGGFLNRFLIIDGGGRVAEVAPRQSLRDVSDRLRSGLHALYRAGLSQRGNLSGAMCKNTAPDPEGVVAPWASQDAADCYAAFSVEMQRRMDASAEAEPFLARTAEIAVRCATIRACGDDPGAPMVTLEHMEWGAALARQSAERLMADAGRFMIDPLGAAEFERKLVEKIKAAGPKGVKMSILHKDMRRHFRYASDMKNALDALARSGIVAVDEKRVPGGVSRSVRMI